MPMRRMTAEDGDRVYALREQSFNQPPAHRDRTRVPPVEYQSVWEEDGAVVAAATAWEIGHFFGGRSVPCAGISGVVVAPEARGKRLAEQLVGGMLREARDRFPISSLYPATVPLYRRLGYEFAAPRVTYKAKIGAIPRLAGAQALQPMTAEDVADAAVAYRAFAATRNGMLDRPDAWWNDRLLRQFGESTVYRYALRESGELTGWVVYTQEEGFHFRMECRDLVWRTPLAVRSILTFVARHRSLGEEIKWHGPPMEPLQLLIPEHDVEVDESWNLMVRLLDVPAAFEARGYAEHAEASVAVEVVDTLIPENAGPWRIAVSGGKCAVEAVSEAGVRVPAGVLASLYSGFAQPRDAAAAGLLEAAEPDIAALESIFAGPSPAITDFF